MMPIPQKRVQEKPMTAKERVYLGLRDWIMDGTLQPGEKLSDVEIADYFSVSRTPVREAIQMLSDQKLVEVIPGKESRVTEIDPIAIQQIYDLLTDLQVKAVEFAFPKINASVIQQLERLNQEFADGIKQKDPVMSLQRDNAFHDVFVQLAGNDFLTDFNATLLAHIARIENRYFHILKERMDSVNIHEKMLEALRNGDLEAAKEEVRNNWRHTKEILRGDLL